MDAVSEVNEAQSAMELIDNPPPPEPEPEKFDLFKVLPEPTKAPNVRCQVTQSIHGIHGIHIVKRMWNSFMTVKIHFLDADGKATSIAEAYTSEEVIDEANGKFFTVGEPEDYRSKCSHCE